MNDPAGPPLILLAEDEPLASMALRAQLEALDYDVVGPARTGDDAIALGSCYPVDIALFDMRMPGRSGLDAAHELFRLAPTPVVLLTGVSAADLPDPIPRPPIFGLLTKPVGLDDLRSALGTARERFSAWRTTEDTATAAENEAADERAVIARALAATPGEDGERPAAPAVRLLQRAREQGRSPAELARDILRAQP